MTTPDLPDLPIAKGRIHFVQTEPGCYNVEVRRGSTSCTIGRICRFGNRWAGLSIGARAWTDYLPTRTAALTQMRRGITWQSTISPPR